jgi:predicted RNA-binding protein YlxR (DUF448 family)
MKKSYPTRMCITCRSRHPQHTLIRLQQKDSEVTVFEGMGRSFYLCNTCVDDEKKIKGLSKRLKQDFEQFAQFLGKFRDGQ